MKSRLSFAVTCLVACSAPSVAFGGPAYSQEHPQSQPAHQSQPEAVLTPLPHVEKRGKGPISMILIPGLACDWSVFDSFMQRNAERYTMYAVTLPGFGGSEPPPMPADNELGRWLENAVRAIWQYAQDKAIEKPVIVGHSMGGHLALQMAIAYPGEFRAIISIDGAPTTPLGGLDDATAATIDRKDAARQVAALNRAFGARQWNARQHLLAGTSVKDPLTAERLAQMFISVPPPITIQYMADYISTDLRPRLSAIVDPTLVIASLPTGDMAEGAEHSARAAWESLVKGGANLKLIFFDHSRHFIQYDRPAELDAALADFIAGREVKDVVTPVSSAQPEREAPAEPSTAPDQSSTGRP